MSVSDVGIFFSRPPFSSLPKETKQSLPFLPLGTEARSFQIYSGAQECTSPRHLWQKSQGPVIAKGIRAGEGGLGGGPERSAGSFIEENVGRHAEIAHCAPDPVLNTLSEFTYLFLTTTPFHN